MKRYVIAVVELADPYDHPLDTDHLCDWASALEQVPGVAEVLTYRSLSDIASDVIEGRLQLPPEALEPS